jgi:PAS domain S-box-containing protein
MPLHKDRRQRRRSGVADKLRGISERRSAQEAQARLAAIVSSSADAIVGETLNGIVTSWNEAAERMFGYSAREMVGQSIRRLIPADRQPEENMILARLAQSEIVRFETKRVAKDGRTFDAAVAISPVRDTEGRIIGASKIIRDITDSKQAAMRLAEHEAQLAQFVEHAPAAIAMFDDKMRYLAVSRRFLSDYALGEPAEVIGRSQYEIFPDIPPHQREVHARVLAGEEVTREEDFFPRQDGRVYWVRWSMKPWRTINGRVGGALLFAEVITEQVEAKRALADSEALFRATFENAAVGIAHVAPDGRWLRVNEALCRILGYPVDEFVTKTFQDVTHPDDLATEVSQVELMFDGKIDSYGADKRYLRKDGAIVWGRKTISCIRKKDGSIDYFVNVIEDISARKRAEELLRRQADLLDQSHDAIFTWKIGGGITYWSGGAEKLYGYTSEEAIGRISHELLETRAHIAMQDVEAQIAQQGSWYGELTHTTRDGHEIVVESRHVRVSYDGDLYALETNRDITERKRAEDALRDGEERLRAIYDGTYQYIGLLSPDGTLLEANRASLEFAGDAFGSKREHVVGRPFWETVWFVHTPGAPEKLREAIARAAAGEFIRYEAPLMRPSGEEVIFDFSLHPVRNTRGDVFLIVPEGRIITDRKRAEEELAESEERMRFIANRAQIGYWDWQIATDRVEWSPINNQLLGIPPEDQMSYARFLAAVHPDDRERTDRAARACLESGGKEGYDVEFRTLWPDGTVRWIRGKGNATFEDGKPARMAGLALDITERKQQEEREHLLVREMNHRVKNILTVVDAIAHRTAAENPEDFAKRFSDRIRALSANQDLLFRNEWQGVDVEELIRAQLSHFADLIGSRIVVDGPKLRFNTVGAQAVGLALHELATNASKYGALSVDRGRVDVCWNFSGDAFTMSWTEREGPSVSTPKRR